MGLRVLEIGRKEASIMLETESRKIQRCNEAFESIVLCSLDKPADYFELI